MKRMKKILVTISSLIAFTLTGCAGGSAKGDPGVGESSVVMENPVSVSVVAGIHSNTNMISFNAEEIRNKIYQCAYSYGTISLIRTDGKPEEFLKADIKAPTTKGLSEKKLESIAQNYVDEIMGIFQTEGKAKYEEVDTLEAIRLAANSLQTTEGERYLLIADSGLSTVGYVDFCHNDLFHTPTEEIVAALEKEKAIPDLTGVRVVWYASQTAEPQARLSEAQKDKLIEIWTAILTEGGAASVEFRSDSASSTPYTDLPKVSVVNTEERAIDVKPLETVALDSETVTFLGDEAVFADPPKAEQEINKVAEILLANPQNQVYVVGSTASSAREGGSGQKLSEERAELVTNTLKSYGVPEEQLKVLGLGNSAPWCVEDRDSEGNLLEAKAKDNRKVMIIDTQDPEYGERIETYFEESTANKCQ